MTVKLSFDTPMREEKVMLSTEEAQKIILSKVKVLGEKEERIVNCLGRVLAEDIYSSLNIPPLTNSAMDGYALKSSDTRGAPLLLKVIEDLPAGRVSTKKIDKGKAIRIMTGAILPEGADAVVEVEKTKREERGFVKVLFRVKRGENVRLAGEDVKKGELVLKKGTTIRAAEVGMLATLGRRKAKVLRAPRVAIISSGDELLEVGKRIRDGKIYDANGYSLQAQVIEASAVPLYLGVVKDKIEALRKKFKEGLKQADLLISSGGVSVGDYDLVRGVLKELGRISFWQVRQRPGKPLVFGLAGRKLIFGLPGNPVSSMVTFEQYVRPALLKMGGRADLKRKEVYAEVTEEIKKRKGLKYFIRAVVRKEDNKYYVKTTGPQGSGILKSMILANGLIILPEKVEKVKKGDKVLVQLWREM
ncbi:MAG: molybdopterin biosynthesis protein MoeA [Armatimonadetes bacterium CG07_land_8_20_14_0_80_40_9]|nr:MAG: molybdopterin biosynthesis protein MoeA [Armatimonadetes bacterium CG07_land_8_20_14_0_80_40_9]